MALFDEYTEEALIEEALNNAPDDIDTRQGSVFYDAVAGIVSIVARLFADADILLEQSSVLTATGEFLDTLANNLYLDKLTREAAVYAQYGVTLTPTDGLDLEDLQLEDDDRFFTENGLYFLLKIVYDDDDNISSCYVQAENPGAAYNDLPSGTEIVPVDTIEFLASAQIGSIIQNGVDEEDDDSFRTRIQEMLASPTENANAGQYKTWCENVSGVGTATIYPLFAGPNTVKAVLTNSNNLPCDSDVVAAVQEYIDPMTLNTQVTYEGVTYTVGDGLGGGVAPLGAHFLAVAADEDIITITIYGLKTSYDSDTVKESILKAVQAYFKTLVNDYDANSEIVIKLIDLYTAINISEVDNFTSVEINGATADYTVPVGSIPTVSSDSIVIEEG